MLNDLEDMLKSAALEVFGTMLNIKVVFDAADRKIERDPFVACTIGFTGKFSGVIYLYTSVLFARRMTANLLNLPEHQIEDQGMINDAMGELTNMHAGYLKSRLCDRGYACVMTIPSVVTGRDFQIVAVSGARRVAICVCAGSTDLVLLELLVKPENHA